MTLKERLQNAATATQLDVAPHGWGDVLPEHLPTKGSFLRTLLDKLMVETWAPAEFHHSNELYDCRADAEWFAFDIVWDDGTTLICVELLHGFTVHIDTTPINFTKANKKPDFSKVIRRVHGL